MIPRPPIPTRPHTRFPHTTLFRSDCAENFSDCSSDVISNRLKVLLQMSLVLVHGMRLPVVRVGRFAGQYAKPRSADSETRDGVTLPSYRGDIVNAPEFTAQARTPDPRRMVKAPARSAMRSEEHASELPSLMRIS